MQPSTVIDNLWVLFGGILLLMVQAGFAMAETGFTRSKNAGNIMVKKFAGIAFGTLVYWCLGYGLMYGADVYGILGTSGYFGAAEPSSGILKAAFLFYQIGLCVSVTTIISGALAERIKFPAYCAAGAVISALFYPLVGHWIWGGGFLQKFGFHDFAGGSAIHSVAGWFALIGAYILGPRIGKYTKDGLSNAIPGHSLTLGALGIFLLLAGWFGFYTGSALGITGDGALEMLTRVFLSTLLAASASGGMTLLLTKLRYGKPDITLTLSGVLSGLVAVSAGCDTFAPGIALFIGIVSAFLMVFGIELIDRHLKIDDPIGVIGVHGINGIAGTLWVGLFASEGSVKGLFFGGGVSLLEVQIAGIIAVGLFSSVTAYALFKLIHATIGLRVSRKEEIRGLDVEEHGLESSYADFQSVDLNM